MLGAWKKSYDQLREHIKKQRHYLAKKGPSHQSYGFSSSMHGCEIWTTRKAEPGELMLLNCGVGEDFWESLGQQGDQIARRKEILKEISPEYSLEGLMLKLQNFGHLMQRTDSFEKTLMLGKIEGRRRSGTMEDEMVGWHHRFDGHEFEQAPGVSDGQGSLVCCSPWGSKELDMTEWLSWIELLSMHLILYVCYP